MTFTPYCYQKEAVDSAMAGYQRKDDSGLIVLPTGSGKTVVGALLADKLLKAGNHITWICHREELKQQALESFEFQGLKVSIWDSKTKDATGDVVVVMVASSINYVSSLPDDERPRVVFVDEAHHEAATSFRRLIEELNPVFKLGFTATPTRLDNVPLNFDNIYIQKTFLDIVDLGYLARPKYIRVLTRVDARFPKGARDFSRIQMSEALDIDERNEVIVNTYVSNIKEYGKVLAFAINVEHAENLAERFRERANVEAYVVHSNINNAERARRVNEYKNNKGPCVFVNVEVAIEGFDCKDVKSVFLCRPTASEVYYLQMVGRGSRRNPDIKDPKKDHFNIVDFVDNHNMYARLASEWSLTHLGRRQTQEEIEEIQLKEDVEQVRRQLREAGVTRVPTNIEIEVYNIYGVLEVVANTGRSRRFVFNRKEIDIIHSLFEWIRTDSQVNTRNQNFNLLIRTYFARNRISRYIHWMQFETIAWAAFQYFVLNRKRVNNKERLKFTRVRLDNANSKATA